MLVLDLGIREVALLGSVVRLMAGLVDQEVGSINVEKGALCEQLPPASPKSEYQDMLSL